MALKRYLVFAGDNYYPGGGWQDFIGSAEFISEAREMAPVNTSMDYLNRNGKYDWANIVDSATGLEVADDEIDPPGADLDDYMDTRAELESDPPPSPERIAELRAKLDATKPEPQGLNAALVARAFEVMLPGHKISLQLTHNEHRNYHQTVGQHLADLDHQPQWTAPVEQQKARETGELWTLYWCPASAGGSHCIAAATLPAIAQWLEDNGLAFGS